MALILGVRNSNQNLNWNRPGKPTDESRKDNGEETLQVTKIKKTHVTKKIHSKKNEET